MSKVLNRIERVLCNVSVASVLVMVCFTTLDAAGRYLLNQPIHGAYAVTEKYFMIITVFFALSYGYHNGSNIRVTFLIGYFSPRVRLTLNYIVQILSVLYGILLVLGSFTTAVGNIKLNLDDFYNLPLLPAYLVAVVGLLMLTLYLFLDLRHVKDGKSGLFADEEKPAAT
jgi:TRAP-type C4-dicarboxylate transport system permease small subunit